MHDFNGDVPPRYLVYCAMDLSEGSDADGDRVEGKEEFADRQADVEEEEFIDHLE
jgi:hypothetical protein